MSALMFLQNRKTLVLLDQAVYSGSSFVATFFLARLLAAADFGLYSGFILILYLMVSAGNALVVQPFQVLRPQYQGDKGYLNFVLILQLVVVIITAAIAGIVLWLTVSPLREYGTISAVAMIAFLFHDFFRKIFLADDKILLTLMIDSTVGVLQLGMLGVAFFYGPFNLFNALLITAVSFTAGAVVGLRFVFTRVCDMLAWRTFFIAHIRHGKWLLLTAVIQWWSGNFFVVAAGMLLGPVALGAFRLVQSLFGILNILLQTYENYVLPQAVRIFSSSVAQSKRYLLQISFKGVVLFGSVLTVLFFFSEEVMKVMGGSQYVDYAYVVKGMCLLYLVIFIGYPVRIAVRMMVLNRIFFIGYLLSFCFSALSFNYLLQQFQLTGAIAGLIINQCILIFFWQYHLSKRKFILWK